MTRSLPMLDEVHSQSESDGDEAGFGALATAGGCLPLAAMDVSGRIDGLLAQVTVRQTFVNATPDPLEATYIFPLPDRAAVAGFRMEVAGRVIEGVLEERSRARRQYDQAVRQGHRASIAEEERPGVFTMRVGNLMPGDVATVQLTMVATLPYHDGEVTFRFPMVVAPRYIPGMPLDGPSVGDGTAVDTDAVPDASRISPPVLLPGFPNPVRLSMTIDLYDAGAAETEGPRVSLHAVWEEVSEGVRRIILRPGARLDRDFILRFRLGGEAPRSSLSLHPDADGIEGTFALTVVPPARAVPTAGRTSRPRDVVFLLDRSGSMAGWKMVAARRATARMIDTLGTNDRFAVVAFDDRIEAPRFGRENVLIPARLVPATDRGRFRAVEFLSKLESRGGTEIARPLGLAVDLLDGRGGDRDRILVLVTDGQVGNEDQVLRQLGARLKGIRVFTLGIDRAVNEGFLRRLADLGRGGGSCEMVESEDRLDAVMESIHRRIGAPVLTAVRIEADGFELAADSMDDRPPSLFAGSPVLLLGRYRGRPRGPIAVRAETPDGTPWHEAVAPAVRENPAIASAWARVQVRRLEDRYAAGLGDLSALEKTIVATSLRFGVLCRFTAYVSIDGRQVVNEGGEVHRVTQPVEMPAGWETTGADFIATTGCLSAPPPDASRSSAMASVPFSPMLADFGLAIRGNRDVRAEKCIEDSSLAPMAFPPRPPSPASPAAVEHIRRAGFTLVQELGRDDHGTLHKARGRVGRVVSIFVLKNPAPLAGPAEFAKLEKQLTGLKHPAIVPISRLIYDAKTGVVYAVVSKFFADQALAEWVGRNGLADARAAARLVLSLAAALEFAGRKGMSHGLLTIDMSHSLLTLEKIRMGKDGSPRIAGFGLGRLGCGPKLSEATAQTDDVESLGAILQQLLSNMPEVPADLDVICRKPYATAGEFAADLRRFLGVKA